MSRHLVVNLDRTTYLVTPGPETTPLTRSRRKVEVHTWADGLVEIHYNGRRLPFTVCDEYPLVTPGEIVERKRVAEVMAQVLKAQADPDRSLVAARVALRTAPAISPSKAPARAPATVIEIAPPGASAEEIETNGGSYVVRWFRKRAFLYERAFAGVARANGRPLLKDKCLGEVEPDVALDWQARGDTTRAPSLLGGKRPRGSAPTRRGPQRAAVPATPRSGSPPAPSAPAPLVDPASRLVAAMWFSDAFHAAESQRILKFNAAAAAEATRDVSPYGPLDQSRHNPKADRPSAGRDATPPHHSEHRSVIEALEGPKDTR